MWLLSTDRAELHHFVSPDQVLGGYAILSHVWDHQEQTFQEVQALSAQCTILGGNPRDLVSPKVRACCILAENHGHKWIWADMCCINRESSAEISEAINSMYLYYSLSSVCYAYLRDVPGGYYSELFFQMSNSPFRSSIWHQRGWTLQELIAPKIVLFLSQDWKLLGTKAELADLLHDITRVPVDVLRMQQDPNTISVARRMSWAAGRKTTRIEDEAYSLLGLFGVSMTTCYGEGRDAFRRLQEEIMKRNVDTSLFAWGTGRFEQPLGASSSPLLARCRVHDNDLCYLLAPSPSSFADCHDIYYRAPRVRSAPVSRSPATLCSY